MGITEYLIIYITQFIADGGYAAIIFFMTLESMVFPVPSEAVMPFAGLLVSTGVFNFWGAIFAGTVGSLIGSLLSYCIGAYGGRPAIKKWGKYFLLNERHLDTAEKFFKHYGEITIFISRFIPVVRHFISIPAGMGKMNILKFSFYTIIGAGIWNVFLIYVGMILGQNWKIIEHYVKFIDIFIALILFVGIVYWLYKVKK